MLRIVLLLFIALLIESCSQTDKTPETALINGKVWTGNKTQPWAEWITISEGTILEVGTGTPPDAEQVLDLEGQLTLPGFNDSHIHFSSAGHLLLNSNLLDVNTTESFIQSIRNTTDRLPSGSWNTRGDWGAYSYALPRASGLDVNLCVKHSCTTISRRTRSCVPCPVVWVCA